MKVHVREEAATELVEAIEYYEDLEPGLGVRLKSEVREHLAIILAAPDRLRQRPRGYRRINLRFFRITSTTSSMARSSGLLPSLTPIAALNTGGSDVRSEVTPMRKGFF